MLLAPQAGVLQPHWAPSPPLYSTLMRNFHPIVQPAPTFLDATCTHCLLSPCWAVRGRAWLGLLHRCPQVAEDCSLGLPCSRLPSSLHTGVMFTPRPHGLALGFGQHQEAPHAFPVPHRAALPSRTGPPARPLRKHFISPSPSPTEMLHVNTWLNITQQKMMYTELCSPVCSD